MSFTNQMLGALGTATGALAAGQHIAEQKKANKEAEAQKEIQVKDLEYTNKKDEIEYKKNMANVYTEMASNPLRNEAGNIITDPSEYRQQQLNNEVNTVLKYKSGKRKEAAQKAIDALQDEMFTLTDLKFNIEKRKEQINILKGVK